MKTYLRALLLCLALLMQAQLAKAATATITLTVTATPSATVPAGTATTSPTPTFYPAAEPDATPGCCQTVGAINAGYNVVIGLAVDEGRQRVYVSDGTSAGIIQVFSYDGSSLGSIASGLSDPYGLALSVGDDFIWVADSQNGALKRFAISGSPATPLETLNVAADTGHTYPHDVALDAYGDVFTEAGTLLAKYAPSGSGHALAATANLGASTGEAVACSEGRVYVGFAGPSDTQVRVFDAATLAELPGSPLGAWTGRGVPAGIFPYQGGFLVAYSGGSYSFFSQSGYGSSSAPLAWSEAYSCSGFMEAKAIAVIPSLNRVLFTQKFGSRVLEFNYCGGVPGITGSPTCTPLAKAATGTPTCTRTATITATPSPSPGHSLPASSATVTPTPTTAPVQSGIVERAVCMPNLVRAHTQVTVFALCSNSLATAELRLYSGSYALVKSFGSGPMAKGWNRFTLPAGWFSGLPNGLYHIALAAPTQASPAKATVFILK